MTPSRTNAGWLSTLADQMISGWPVRYRQPASMAWRSGQADVVPLRLLAEALQSNHPEAGPIYWSVRGYGLLIWQPAWLAVASATLVRRVAPLDQLSQDIHGAMVWGVSVEHDGSTYPACQDSLERSAMLLRELTHRLHAEWNAVQPLHAKLAGRIVADAVLTGLLAATRGRPASTPQASLRLAERWLEALDLPGASGLMCVERDTGDARFALHRRACCQHFRRDDGGLCATCPKHQPAARQAAIRRTLEQHDFAT